MHPTKALLGKLICLHCRGTLTPGEETFVCEACGHAYPVDRGAPVIMREHNLAVQEPPTPPARGVGWRLKRAASRALDAVPGSRVSTATAANFRYLSTLLPPEPAVLFVGGGVRALGDEVSELGTPVLEEAINLEICGGPAVDLVADGHEVPFPDATFDLVVSQAVLEHTRDPWRMVREAQRLLKRRGVIFVDVPFLQPVHMHADFWRFTTMGLEELLRDFERLDAGVNAGPGSAAATIQSHFLAALFSFGREKWYRRGARIFARLTSPLAQTDRLFARWNLPPVAPSSVYFIGRRR